MLSDAVQDVRFGLRLLRRSPVFTTVAVSSLALGIGGAAAVFSLLNAIVLRNLPAVEPDRRSLPSGIAPTTCRHASRGRRTVSAARRAGGARPSLRRRARWPPCNFGPRAPLQARQPSAALSSSYGKNISRFSGRDRRPDLLTRDDNRALDGHPVVVVSHGYWKAQSRRFIRTRSARPLASTVRRSRIVGIYGARVLWHDRVDARVRMRGYRW